MSQKVNMNVFLHYLLVIKEINEFTVIEARDILVQEHSEFTDADMARKYIYRHLLWAVNNDFLKRTDHVEDGIKKVIYSKTEAFFDSIFSPVNRGKKQKLKLHRKAAAKQNTENYKELLEKELMTYELDLTTCIEEAKEYKRLSTRFPELKEKLQQLHLQTKSQSTELLGKVRALQRLLGHKITGAASC